MDNQTRQHILSVALRHFADRGYAGTSVQDIVDEAGVAKPMLYYYFESKAGLFQALIDSAHEERFRVLSAAAAEHEGLEQKLVAVLNALFRFIKSHRELVRLAFASAFAGPGELPPELSYKEGCHRSFDYFHGLIREGLAKGELDSSYDSQAITMHWYGLMNIFVMGQLFQPEVSFDESAARSAVDLFFHGAGASRRKTGPVRTATSRTHRIHSSAA